MKTTQALLPAAFAAAAFAQASVSYTTITAYTDVCSDEPVTSTTTATITSQVCAICTEGRLPATVSGVLTTYTTVYQNICPTGSTLTPATYTVTEVCPSESVGQALPKTYVPQGFTTTVASCACEGGSATLTVPAPTAAPTGAPAAPAAPTAPRAGSPAPAAGSSSPEVPAGGSPSYGSPSNGSPSGVPAGSSPSQASPAGASPEEDYPAGNSPAEHSPDNDTPEGDTTVLSTPAAATVTNSVNLASNGSVTGGNGTGYVPSSPLAQGAGSRPMISLCGTLLAAVAVVVYAL